MMTHLPRVLIAAPNASFRFGGEAVLPLRWYLDLRQAGDDVHLLTHARGQPSVVEAVTEAGLAGDLADRIHFVPDSWADRVLFGVARVCPRGLQTALHDGPGWLLTQRRMRPWLRGPAPRAGRFDVLYVPTPVSPRFPLWWGKLPMPVVVGPLNGNMTYPPGFTDRTASAGWQRLTVGAAKALAGGLHRLWPGLADAAVVLVANPRTVEGLPVGVPRPPGRIRPMPENTIDLDRWPAPTPPRNGPGLRMIYVGRFIPLKGIDLLLRAMQRVPDDVTLTLVGEGVELDRLRALAHELGVTATFMPWQPPSRMPGLLAEHDALVLPSVHEAGGAVVLEAMASGRPVIAANWGGPRETLSQGGGILAPVNSPQALMQGLADAIHRLRDPAMRAIHATEARSAIQFFSRSHQIARMRAILQQATHG